MPAITRWQQGVAHLLRGVNYDYARILISGMDGAIYFASMTGGNLWYDLDGSGKGKAVLIAVLDNHVQIEHTDFWVI